MSLADSAAPDHPGAAGQDDQAGEVHTPRASHGQGGAQALIASGIPLGRKKKNSSRKKTPRARGRGPAVAGGEQPQAGHCWGSKYPFGMSPCLCLLFFWGGKHLISTWIQSGSGWIWDLSWLFSVWEADFLTGGCEIPYSSRIHGGPGTAQGGLSLPRRIFSFHSLSFGAALQQESPWKWRVGSSVL